MLIETEWADLDFGESAVQIVSKRHRTNEDGTICHKGGSRWWIPYDQVRTIYVDNNADIWWIVHVRTEGQSLPGITLKADEEASRTAIAEMIRRIEAQRAAHSIDSSAFKLLHMNKEDSSD
ncbi:MAG TPA: hypothetical protein VMW24_25060 [Sedimentisphaerales bacterium]|nr:hypothetical protein [Sedimentisphaerales bacterium]